MGVVGSWGLSCLIVRGEILGCAKHGLCESICRGCFHWSRTETTRYRPSLNHELCQLELGGRCRYDPFNTLYIINVFGFRGEYGCKVDLLWLMRGPLSQ